MQSHSAALGNSAPPYRISHRGRTFKLPLLDGAAKAAFERRLTEQAMAAAALAPASVQTVALAAVARDAAGGAFSFLGSASQQALCSPAGLLLLTCVLAGCSMEEAVELMSDRGPELQAMLDVIVLESLPQTARERVLAAREEEKQKAEEEGRAPEAVPTQPAA